MLQETQVHHRVLTHRPVVRLLVGKVKMQGAVAEADLGKVPRVNHRQAKLMS